MLWQSSPLRYWLKYLAPPEFRVRHAQTAAMAVGNVFDSHIKAHVGRMMGFKPTGLLKGVDERFITAAAQRQPGEDGLVLYKGIEAFHAYRDSPAMKRLFRHVVSCETPAEPRLVQTPMGMVPVWGILDAEMHYDGHPVVMDWKCSGAFSSPRIEPGYWHAYTCEPLDGRPRWVDLGPHARCLETLECLNKQWAVQTCIYNWLKGYEGDHWAEINKILMTQPIPQIYIYKGMVSRTFQEEVRLALGQLWHAIQTDTVLPEEYRDMPADLLMAMV